MLLMPEFLESKKRASFKFCGLRAYSSAKRGCQPQLILPLSSDCSYIIVEATYLYVFLPVLMLIMNLTWDQPPGLIQPNMASHSKTELFIIVKQQRVASLLIRLVI